MKTNLLKFKKLNIVIAAMPLMLLVACQSDVQTNNVQTESVETDNTDSVQANDTVPALDTSTSENVQAKIQPHSQPSEYAEFSAALQGAWERVDYPFGTVEFKGNQVKLTAGEGAVEPAKFEDFKIADECPDSIDAQASALAYDFLVVADKRCEPIKINGSKLTLDYSGTSNGIEYERMGKPSSAVVKALNTIPSNFHGKWADKKANCTGDNPQQMTITANKIIFFENEATLLKVKQFEPTRLEADFDYLRIEADLDNPRDEADRKPYFNTLDLQNDSQELIMRENGAAPIKSIKCV